MRRNNYWIFIILSWKCSFIYISFTFVLHLSFRLINDSYIHLYFRYSLSVFLILVFIMWSFLLEWFIMKSEIQRRWRWEGIDMHLCVFAVQCISCKLNLIMVAWFKLQPIFATAPATSKNDNCYKSFQNWLENNHPPTLICKYWGMTVKISKIKGRTCHFPDLEPLKRLKKDTRLFWPEEVIYMSQATSEISHYR
jgi:hypothetical protein